MSSSGSQNTDSGDFPVAAIVCLAIGGYALVIFIIIGVRQLLRSRGMCEASECGLCGTPGEPCCGCCVSLSESCNCCTCSGIDSCLESCCPNRKNVSCVDMILCQCSDEPNCCSKQEETSSSGSCSCRDSCVDICSNRSSCSCQDSCSETCSNMSCKCHCKPVTCCCPFKLIYTGGNNQSPVFPSGVFLQGDMEERKEILEATDDFLKSLSASELSEVASCVRSGHMLQLSSMGNQY
ncbi:hypothetical protein ScPMuIL_007139 [Solemya velum]